jgi:plastocyanin
MRIQRWTSCQLGCCVRLLTVTAATILMVLSMGARTQANTKVNTVVVKMSDKPTMYMPAKLTVKAGTTVVWKNTAGSIHDVTTDPDSVQNARDVSLPPNVKPFDSGFIPPGGSWSYTFTVPGHYEYTCVPHEKDKMIGVITVTK